MRKLVVSTVLCLAALVLTVAPALAGSIGPTP